MSLIDKYIHRFDKKSSGCWEWNGYINIGGYGSQITGSREDGTRRQVLAHRLFYKLYYGEFDNKLCVLHKCDNPKCVNPEHLFLGTQLDNVIDMTQKGRRVDHVGELNGVSKLKEEDVMDIRMYLLSGIKQIDIARVYNVHQTLISAIKTNKIWRGIV